MAGLIKNQILKHLSKFTKNLSPDKISLSAMKGEGDLSNLELDEMVLTDLLALPGWIRLKKATCNKVTIKIQWTKLNSQPICLYLDEVTVEMETCDVPRTPTSATPVSSYNKGGKYGFAEQIIDGICLSINSVVVNFRSNKFNASIQVSRIIVQSKTPKWQDGDLFMTRLKNDLVGEVMIFKEAEWQTLRIEANALDTGDPRLATTPLRLIANQSKIRITIKKKISDCSIVSSKLEVNLDDLLWVLTDSQLSAAMTFAAALQETISKSADSAHHPKKDDGTQSQTPTSSSSSTASSSSSHQNQPFPHQHPHQHHSHQHTTRPAKVGSKTQQQKAKIFDMYNITETSYHLNTGRIDLHLCDDASPEESSYQRKVEGGAIQLVLYHLEFDIYPYHRAGESRTRWPKYEDSVKQRDAWASELLRTFKEDVRTVREAYKASANPSSVASNNIPADGVVLRPNPGTKSSTIPVDQYVFLKDGKPVLKTQSSELLENCIVARVEDFELFRVSTALDSKRRTPKKFFSSDKKQLLLPPEMPSILAVFTEYYFPDGRDFPVPHSNLFIVVNPICLAVDYLTLLWMNMFSLNLAKKVEEIPKKQPSKLHTDIRLEALMPRIILPETDVIETRGRPGDYDGLQLQMSKVIVTNCRLDDSRASRTDLKSSLEEYVSSPLFGNSPEFPNETDDCLAIARRFHEHVSRIDDGYPDPSVEEILRRRDATAGKFTTCNIPPSAQRVSSPMTSSYFNMTMNSFRLNVDKDVWCVVVDLVWLEFTLVKNSFTRNARTLPLLESFPLTIWLYQFPSTSEGDEATSPTGKILPHNAADKSTDIQSEIASSVSENVKLLDPSSSDHADVYVLMKIDVKIQLQIDHKRYSFLINLMETVSRCSEEMEADFKNITGKTVTPKKAVLSVIVREVEVALLFPPSRDVSSQLTSPDDVGNSLGLTSAQDNTGSQLTLSEDGILDQSVKLPFDDADPLPVAETSPSSFTPPPEQTDFLSTKDLNFAAYPVEVGNDAVCLLDEDEVEESEPRLFIGNGSAGISLGGSRGHSPEPRLTPGNIPRSASRDSSSFTSSKKPQDIKKSLNQAFSSITSKLGGPRNPMRRGPASSRADDTGMDNWETLSVTSGSLSDEDEDYVWESIESQVERPAFERRTMITDDSSIVEAESDDTSSSFTATFNKKVVSVSILNVGGIEAVVQNQGKEVSLRAVVRNFCLAEGGTMEMEKFLQSVTSGSKDFTQWPQKPPGAQPIIRARFDLGRKAEVLQPAAGDLGFVRALVDGIKVKLLATCLKNIGDLFEDNKPSPPNFLMNAVLSNVAVTFVDDKMPTYLPEPKNTTIDLVLHQTVIKRGKDGIFRMGDSDPVPNVEKEQLRTELNCKDSAYVSRILNSEVVTLDKPNEETDEKPPLEIENDLLRRQLEKIGKMPCCCQECDDHRRKGEALEMVEAENKELRREMEHQMKELLSLKEEREALLTVVQKLQDDLSYSERMRNRPNLSS